MTRKVENKQNICSTRHMLRLKFVEIRGTLTHPEVLHHAQKVFKQIGRLSIHQRNQLKGEMLHISIRPWRFYSNKKIRKLIFFQVFPSSFWCTFEPPLSDAPQSSHRSFANPSPEKYHPETEGNLPLGKANENPLPQLVVWRFSHGYISTMIDGLHVAFLPTERKQPWKINGCKLKFTQLNRKIIWTKPPWLWVQILISRIFSYVFHCSGKLLAG